MKKNTPKKPDVSKGRTLIWPVFFCVIFCQLMVYTWVRTESTQTIFRISHARGIYESKVSYHNELLVEKGRLTSDERITRIARTHLNLSGNTMEQTIYFSGAE